MKRRKLSIGPHLLDRQAALCPWEPLNQDGPQVGLPQAAAIHLRGQTADLSRRTLAGFVGQLDGRERRLMAQKRMRDDDKQTKSEAAE